MGFLVGEISCSRCVDVEPDFSIATGKPLAMGQRSMSVASVTDSRKLVDGSNLAWSEDIFSNGYTESMKLKYVIGARERPSYPVRSRQVERWTWTRSVATRSKSAIIELHEMQFSWKLPTNLTGSSLYHPRLKIRLDYIDMPK